MVNSRSNLVVEAEKIMNLLGIPIRIFDSTGDILEIEPSKIVINRDGELAPPSKAFYVVDDSTKIKPTLESDRRYAPILAKAINCGHDRTGKTLFHLYTYDGINITPAAY